MVDNHCQGNLDLSACGALTRIAVTCACILTSQRSTMGRPFSFIADANALLPLMCFIEERILRNPQENVWEMRPGCRAATNYIPARTHPSRLGLALPGINLRPGLPSSDGQNADVHALSHGRIQRTNLFWSECQESNPGPHSPSPPARDKNLLDPKSSVLALHSCAHFTVCSS